jgi:hypothetical protein
MHFSQPYAGFCGGGDPHSACGRCAPPLPAPEQSGHLGINDRCVRWESNAPRAASTDAVGENDQAAVGGKRSPARPLQVNVRYRGCSSAQPHRSQALAFNMSAGCPGRGAGNRARVPLAGNFRPSGSSAEAPITNSTTSCKQVSRQGCCFATQSRATWLSRYAQPHAVSPLRCSRIPSH